MTSVSKNSMWSDLIFGLNLIPGTWYRDDCFDVELNKTEEEINEFTDFLNQLVPGIKFKPKIRSDHIEFLEMFTEHEVEIFAVHINFFNLNEFFLSICMQHTDKKVPRK